MKKKDLYKQVERAQSGDKKALEIICRELQGIVKTELLRLKNDPDLVEDLAQETFVRLIKGIRNIKNPVKIVNFVSKIALFVVNDYFRAHYKLKDYIVPDEKPQGKLYSDEIAPSKDNVDEALLNQITIDEIIREIPDQIDKRLIILKLEGKSTKEISHELSLSEVTVKRRFRKTKEYLKNKL